jgi:hypothetical protein
MVFVSLNTYNDEWRCKGSRRRRERRISSNSGGGAGRLEGRAFITTTALPFATLFAHYISTFIRIRVLNRCFSVLVAEVCDRMGLFASFRKSALLQRVGSSWKQSALQKAAPSVGFKLAFG